MGCFSWTQLAGIGRRIRKLRMIRSLNVRFWHKADITIVPANVRFFWGQSGHRKFGPSCPLMTQSGPPCGNQIVN
jgi:hypothetical protein